MKIPHDVIALRTLIYAIGDRELTAADRAAILDLTRAIARRRTRSTR